MGGEGCTRVTESVIRLIVLCGAARRDVLPGVTLATIKANTGEVGAVFAKGLSSFWHLSPRSESEIVFISDTVIHPLSAVDASGHICPNAASRHCGRSSLPTDEAGIVIKSTGWYYVYGSVEFGTITQPTLLGWKIVVCHSLKHSGKSQCALNNGIRSTFEARRQALPTGNPLKGEPGTLFGGKVMYCYANDVISIMPLFNNLKINMYQETTYLGVYKLA